MVIAIGSKSAIKIAAVVAALRQLGLAEKVKLLSCAAPSNIDEQPIGADLTAFGAEERARGTSHIASDFALGIESGIEVIRGHWWVDRATVVVLSTASMEVAALATSAGIPFPLKAVHRCLEKGPRHHTVAEYMIHEYGGSAKDGTMTITGGKVSRMQLLTTAVYLALLQLPDFNAGLCP